LHDRHAAGPDDPTARPGFAEQLAEAAEVEEMKRRVAPEAVLDAIEESEEG
jgi:hypothetical protein